jgi:hypothetical protein
MRSAQGRIKGINADFVLLPQRFDQLRLAEEFFDGFRAGGAVSLRRRSGQRRRFRRMPHRERRIDQHADPRRPERVLLRPIMRIEGDDQQSG